MINILNSLLKPFDIQVNRASLLKYEKEVYKTSTEGLFNFYQNSFNRNHKTINKEISGIVFSKNRAMQLHALLSSYFHYTKNSAPLCVLYTYTNGQHKETYEILRREFSTFPVTFIFETNFESQLKKIVFELNTDRLFFMTDDGIFLDHYDLDDCLNFNPWENIFSLRLGGDFDFCYTHNRMQEIPIFSEINTGNIKMNGWIWNDMVGSPDWIYPLSVDATVFLKQEIALILQHISFKSPNSLEAQLQFYSPLFILRNGICYPKVKYVNVPCNLVQTDYENIFTGTFTADELATNFLDMERIDWSKFKNLNASDAQQQRFLFKKATTIS